MLSQIVISFKYFYQHILCYSLLIRYELFMDVVTPDNLNIGFLREFMMLPTSYYETGAAIKFRKLKKIPLNCS